MIVSLQEKRSEKMDRDYVYYEYTNSLCNECLKVINRVKSGQEFDTKGIQIKLIIFQKLLEAFLYFEDYHNFLNLREDFLHIVIIS